MPRSILQVITATHRRGAEVYAVDLRDELRRRGLPMDLLALQAASAGPTLDVPALATRRTAAAWRLRRAAQGRRGLLAHGSSTLLAAVAATTGTAVPFVYRSIGDPTYWSRRGSRHWRVAAELRRARAVVTTSVGGADTLVRSYAVPSDRVHVIANARPLERFPEPDEAARQEARHALLPAVQGPVVALVGALSPEKDPILAVRAVAQLSDVHLLVVGDGPQRAQLAAYARTVAPGRVHVVGPLADPRPAYLTADAVLITSRTEGFPGVAIEAGLCATPTVSTDVGAVREVVLDGVTGQVVDADRDALADALRSVLADRQALGQAARSHCARTFTMERIGGQWAELLDACLP